MTIHPIRARQSDPDTSHQAAQSVDRLKAADVRREVLRELRTLNLMAYVRDHTEPVGMTDEELLARFPEGTVSASGLRTRRSELVKDGLVKDSGLRRATRSGRPAIVWAAV